MARTRHTRIASRSVLGKRRRAGNATRPSKRRRAGGRRNSTVSTKSSSGGQLSFRSKRLSRRRWKSMLWNATLQKSHYRSNTSQQTSLFTPTSPANVGIIMLDAIQNGGNPFWTSSGGTFPLNDGGTVPSFAGDVILRGGKVGISFANQLLDSSPIKCELFLVQSKLNGSSAFIPGSALAGWDPTLIPDFRNNVGTIRLRRRFMLENSNAVSFEHRIGIQKIDTAAWNLTLPNVAGGKWYWILTVQNLESIVSAAITCVRYHNLSFSADAV